MTAAYQFRTVPLLVAGVLLSASCGAYALTYGEIENLVIESATENTVALKTLQ